jgi:hypothetical protein
VKTLTTQNFNWWWNTNRFQSFATGKCLTLDSTEFRIGVECQRREGRAQVKTLTTQNFNWWWNTNGVQHDTVAECSAINPTEFRWNGEMDRNARQHKKVWLRISVSLESDSKINDENDL